MTAFTIIVVIALFIVLIGFTWYRLEAFEGIERVIICVSGILISWLITNILFSLSANGLNYVNKELKMEVSKILVLIFTPINGIALMPYIGKLISQVKFEEIEKKDVIKKIIIFGIILIAIFFVEIKYLTNIQLGILDIAGQL